MASYLLYDYERESRLLDQRITVRREAHGRRWVGGRDGGRQKWGLVLRGRGEGEVQVRGPTKVKGGIKTEVSSRTIGEERTHSVTSCIMERGIDIFSCFLTYAWAKIPRRQVLRPCSSCITCATPPPPSPPSAVSVLYMLPPLLYQRGAAQEPAPWQQQ